jgi:endonuclease-3
LHFIVDLADKFLGMHQKTDWPEAIKPLLKKYKTYKHPLDYHNNYQLLVMVVLAAQATDAHINKLAPEFFRKYPDMASLAKTPLSSLQKSLAGIRNFFNKAKWLSGIAKAIKKDENIPTTLDELTSLPGIGRKSANVIKREMGAPAEGVIVDLHVVRVAPRLGIASGTDPKKIEKKIMETLPPKQWEAGMAMSFHGREICRPKPNCGICFMKDVCEFYAKNARS